MESFSTKNQYYTTLAANIIALGVGASIGWSSPFLPVLQSDESILQEPLTADQASWVGSIFAIGALFGTLLYGYLSEKLGRFWSLLLTSIPQILWWLSVFIGNTVYILLIGRFLAGLCAGGVFVVVPLYVSEISDDNLRGTLGSIFILSINFGTLFMFVAGNYLSYSLVPTIMIALPILFALTFVFLPESPQYLLQVKKSKHAEKSLMFLRGCERSVEVPSKILNELEEMSKKIHQDSNEKNESIFKELNSKASKKALIIGFVLVATNQLCGCFAFINYTAEIFKESGSSLSPNMSAIVVAIIQLAGSIVSTFVIGRMSRKLLYSITCFGTIAGLVTFGSYGYLNMYYDMTDYAWLPIASLSFVIFIASIGLLPLTFVMLSEILPQKIRSFGVSLCTAALWILSFLLLRYFAALVALLQLYVCMFIFSIFTVLGMVFVIFIAPETRSKSSEDIEKSLEK